MKVIGKYPARVVFAAQLTLIVAAIARRMYRGIPRGGGNCICESDSSVSGVCWNWMIEK